MVGELGADSDPSGTGRRVRSGLALLLLGIMWTLLSRIVALAAAQSADGSLPGADDLIWLGPLGSIAGLVLIAAGSARARVAATAATAILVAAVALHAWGAGLVAALLYPLMLWLSGGVLWRLATTGRDGSSARHARWTMRFGCGALAVGLGLAAWIGPTLGAAAPADVAAVVMDDRPALALAGILWVLLVTLGEAFLLFGTYTCHRALARRARHLATFAPRARARVAAAARPAKAAHASDWHEPRRSLGSR